MKSAIINMVDRMKDSTDLKLESLFASDSIADDGFSATIEKRIRRQLWVRRLTLPIAVLIGGLVSAKPLAGLVTALFKLAAVVPVNVTDNIAPLSSGSLPQFSTIMFGGILVLAFVLFTRLLED